MAAQDDPNFCPQIAELEAEKKDLERQVNEQKAKCEAIEKREVERRLVEEKKHNEEIQFLKRTNQQLKVGTPPPTASPRPTRCQGVKEAAVGMGRGGEGMVKIYYVSFPAIGLWIPTTHQPHSPVEGVFPLEISHPSPGRGR